MAQETIHLFGCKHRAGWIIGVCQKDYLRAWSQGAQDRLEIVPVVFHRDVDHPTVHLLSCQPIHHKAASRSNGFVSWS